MSNEVFRKFEDGSFAFLGGEPSKNFLFEAGILPDIQHQREAGDTVAVVVNDRHPSQWIIGVHVFVGGHDLPPGYSVFFYPREKFSLEEAFEAFVSLMREDGLELAISGVAGWPKAN